MNITVYCGANYGTDKSYKKSAELLGEWIAENGHRLIYGGGKAGLMGVVAASALNSGAEVVGVIPTVLAEKEMSYNGLTELFVVDGMHARKKKMIELGDCYIALPGGPGTLEEITEVISWSAIGEQKNPCIFFNQNGYYDLLAKFFDNMNESGFLSESGREKILFTTSLSEMQKFIEDYQSPVFREYDI